LFVRGGAIEDAQRVLDALHGADRIVGVQQAADKGFPPPAPSLLSLPRKRRLGRKASFYAGCSIYRRLNLFDMGLSAPARCAL
jgi:hypothetical protein